MGGSCAPKRQRVCQEKRSIVTRYMYIFILTIRIFSGRKFDGMKDDGVLVSVCVYFNGFMAAS